MQYVGVGSGFARLYALTGMLFLAAGCSGKAKPDSNDTASDGAIQLAGGTSSFAPLVASPGSLIVPVGGSEAISVSGGKTPYFFSVVLGTGTVDLGGLYTAGATAGAEKIRVTDGLGNTVEVLVTVLAPLTVTPPVGSVGAGQTLTFTGVGGKTPYSYSVASGGGTVGLSTGIYVAPASAGSAVVRVIDALGQTADAAVTIAAAVTISPSVVTLAANGTAAFMAASGTAPYSFSVVSGAGSVDPLSGLYTAPAVAGTAVIRVTDSLGTSADANVTVAGAVDISPASVNLAVGNTTAFSAAGGIAPYTYSLVSGGGTVVSGTGGYTAPGTAGTAVVRVTDSLGQTSQATVNISAALALSPAAVNVVANGTVTFTASAGVSPYTFSVLSGGGTVHASSGVYTAPGTAGAATLRVTDALLNTADAAVTVAAPVAISPASVTLDANAAQTFSGSGGLAPYAFSVIAGGGTVNAVSGAYVAPGAGGAATIRITDALGQTADSAVTINAIANLVLSPATVNFGSANLGAVAEATVQLQNTGGASATGIVAGALALPFKYRGNVYPGGTGTCGASLAAGASCNLVVQFIPQTAGVVNASLALSYSAGAVSAALTGTGVAVAPTQVAITGPNAIGVNQCVPFAVEARTAAGVPSAVPSNRTANLVLNNATGTFYSNSGCSVSVTSVTLTTGAPSTSFYFRTTTANQSATFITTTTGLSSGSLPVAIGGTATRLLISGPTEILQNVCQAVQVSRMDAGGTKIADQNAMTVVLSSSGAANLYTAADCSGAPLSSASLGAYTHTLSLYLKNSVAEAFTVDADDQAGLLTSDTENFNAVSALTWWNPAWTRRMAIRLNNLDQAAALTDLPVLIKLTDARVNYDDFLAGGADLRILAADHTTVLTHEIESWTPGGDSWVWVKVPAVAASSDQTVVYVYYGNAGASGAGSGAAAWSAYWGVWHLNDNPGGMSPQHRDATSGARHGTAVSSPTAVAGRIAGGVGMGGNFDTVDLGVDLSPVIGASSTFSAWFKTSQVGNDTTWLAPGLTGVEQSGGGNDIFFGWIDGTGRIGVTAGNGAAAKSGFVINDNTWRHVSITRNHVSGVVQFFINGVLNGSGTSETGLKTTYFDRFGEIADTGGTPTEYDGDLDEIRLFNSVQTADRVKADYKFMVDTHLQYYAPEQAP